ncbi:MAG: hypothetical protein ABR609_11790 [Acidimicrobiia bacterium]
MAGFMVCALVVPGAFGDAALAIGLGYLMVCWFMLVCVPSQGREVIRFAPSNLLDRFRFLVANGSR